MPERGAAYLVGSGPFALIETGTPKSAPILAAALKGLDLAFVFVTHVHLDHAGGAGAIAKTHPDATIVAHPRAVRHLEDPRRLVEGVRAASPELFALYGEPIPIPSEQLHAAADGERFPLGDRTIETLHTPGHAPHHICCFDTGQRVLFTGDAAGNADIPVDVPLTVPPRFDVDHSITTLRRLRDLRPLALAYTHFGFAEGDADARLVAYEDQIRAWFDRIRSLRTEHVPEEVTRIVLSDPKYARLEATDRNSIEMCVRGALLTLENENR